METTFSKFVFKLEIAWSLTWSFLLLIYYFVLFYQYSFTDIILPDLLNTLMWKFILQIIFILASLLSLSLVWLKKNNITDFKNGFLSEGSRVTFGVLNLSFYIFDLFDLNQIKIYFEYMWLILPWLLWIPIVIDLSNSVKQELSWIK